MFALARCMRIALLSVLAICSFVTVAGDVSAGDTFDRDAASSAMSGVEIGRCKAKKGPTGEGHVVVTFSPTGAAVSATVDRAPFAGTKVGTCVAKAYKKAKIPPFAGDPVTVGKLFHIE